MARRGPGGWSVDWQKETDRAVKDVEDKVVGFAESVVDGRLARKLNEVAEDFEDEFIDFVSEDTHGEYAPIGFVKPDTMADEKASVGRRTGASSSSSRPSSSSSSSSSSSAASRGGKKSDPEAYDFELADELEHRAKSDPAAHARPTATPATSSARTAAPPAAAPAASAAAPAATPSPSSQAMLMQQNAQLQQQLFALQQQQSNLLRLQASMPPEQQAALSQQLLTLSEQVNQVLQMQANVVMQLANAGATQATFAPPPSSSPPSSSSPHTATAAAAPATAPAPAAAPSKEVDFDDFFAVRKM